MKLIVKRIVSLISILCIISSYTVFSAVGGNDGSAFITKAEFDAVVNTFNEQMDNYENNLGSKIDGAIANYLAGLSNVSTVSRKILLPNAANSGVLSISSNAKLDYDYGVPQFRGTAARADALAASKYTQNQGGSCFVVTMNMNSTADDYKIKKTVISNLNESTTSLKSTAKWEGYYENGYDIVNCSYIESNDIYNRITSWNTSGTYWSVEHAMLKSNENYIGNNGSVVSFRMTNSSGAQANNGYMFSAAPSSIDHIWGDNTSPYISVFTSYDYDMFSNMDRDKNWGYDGNYMTSFDGETWNNKSYTKTGSYGRVFTTSIFNKAFGTTSFYAVSGVTNKNTFSANHTTSNNVCSLVATNKYYVPMVGFERTYLTNWKQIYDGNTTTIADFESSKHSSSTTVANAVLTDKDGVKYMSVASGFPLIKLNKGEKFSYTLKFKDLSKNYVVWVSDRPFNLDTHPDTNDCIEISGLEKANRTDKGYMVYNGKGEFSTNNMNEDCILYLKWGIYNSDKSKIAGGRLMPEQEGIITIDN